ncbi:hypothetical protein vseg_009192 [Gypsophila vaccaria]
MRKFVVILRWRSCRFFSSSVFGRINGGKSVPVVCNKLADLMLTAYIAKTLSKFGTESLDVKNVPVSESIVLNVLRKTLVDTSKKIGFFVWCKEKRGFKHTAETYAQILRVICSSRSRAYLNDHLVGDVLSSMKHDSVLVDSGTFKLLLDAFIHSGQMDSALEIIHRMEGLGVILSPYVYNSVVVALVRKNQLDLAVAMFNKLLETPVNCGGSVPCVPATCNELLVSLRRAGMRDEFEKVFYGLHEKNVALDTWGYNICIHSFGCWGDLRTSLSLFKQMKESSDGYSTGPDLCTYNSLILVLCTVGKVKDALVVWEELKDSGHEPDAFTYRILVQGCCKSYLIEDATKVFNDMQSNGFVPETVLYNSLLNGFLKARKLSEACQLFEKMTQDGVRASSWTYNILIDGLIKNGRAIAGYSLFCDLKKKGQFVDGVTYSIIILHLSREGQIEEALRLVEEMEARGFVVDLVTITSLLICLYKHGLWDSTERLMRHIRDGDLLHNVHKWKANMDASLRHPVQSREDLTPIFPAKGDFSEIVDLLSSCVEQDRNGEVADQELALDVDEWSSSPHMDHLANVAELNSKSDAHLFKWFSSSKGKRVQGKGMDSFDIDMVNTYMSILLAKGKLSIACKLFEIFTDMGADAVSYTYNSIMSFFVKKGYFDQTWGVLSEMGSNLCPADVATYNIIIQSLGKMGRADVASSILDKLMKEGGYLDIVMYNTLINALGKAGRIDEVKKFFEQMKSSGITPDVVTFNTLIEVHTKMGRLKDANRYLRMMLDAGCLPNHVTDTILDVLGKEMEKPRPQKTSIKFTN